MWWVWLIVAPACLTTGAMVGFCVGALMATAKHDDECAKCWSRAMRGVRPADEYSEVDGG